MAGSTDGVVVGTLVSLYGATGLGQAIQNAQNVAWSVPSNSRPNPFLQRLRSLLLLVVIGLALLLVSAAAAIASATDLFGLGIGEWWVPWLVRLLNVLLVGGVLSVLFRMAGSRAHHIVRAAPGAFAVALMWQLLQAAGTYYVTRVLANTSSMNQTFGLVLGLIGLIYVGAVLAMIGITINVAYAGMARAQRLKGFETVTVEFGPAPLPESAADPEPRAE